MIDFIIVSSDLWPYDTQVKKGVKLSTKQHLEVSWIWWQCRTLNRPGKLKSIVRVNWERLVELLVRAVNLPLQESFHISQGKLGILNRPCAGPLLQM